MTFFLYFVSRMVLRTKSHSPVPAELICDSNQSVGKQSRRRSLDNTNIYPQVLKTMAKFIEGTPKVQTSDVVNSTFHKIAVQATA